MNDMQTVAITSFVLLPLVIVLLELTNFLANSFCDRFMGRMDLLDDELTLARVDSLKSEVWKRIDELECFDSMSDLLLAKIDTGQTFMAFRHCREDSVPMSGRRRSVVTASH